MSVIEDLYEHIRIAKSFMELASKKSNKGADYQEVKKQLNRVIRAVSQANCLAQQLQNELLGVKDPNQKLNPNPCPICWGKRLIIGDSCSCGRKGTA